MNLIRIYGLFLRHFYLITRSFPRILDLIYWPSIQIFLWGFISKFFTLSSSYYNNTVGVILSAAILYDFLFRSSISYNMMFLEDYKKEKKISVLLASHNMEEVKRLCSSVLMMKNGLIVDRGTPEELITKYGRRNLEEVFLEIVRKDK